MLKCFSLVALSLLAVGCATGRSIRFVYTKDGADVYEAACHGGRNTMSDCYRIATESCEGGRYKEVTAETQNGFAPTAIGYIPTITRNLAFTCEP